MEQPQRFRSAADIESDIRAGRYRSYTAACIALSKSKLLTDEKKSELRQLAADVIKIRSTKIAAREWTAKSPQAPQPQPPDPPQPEQGPPDSSPGSSETSSRLGGPSRSPYESLRQLRDAMAGELARLDAELAGYEDEVSRDAVLEAASSLSREASDQIASDWEAVRAVAPDVALELVRQLCSGPSIGRGDASRAVALIAAAHARS